MLSFIIRRFLSAIPTLLIIITISFFLIRLAPGGPFDLERPLEAKVMENLNRIYQARQAADPAILALPYRRGARRFRSLVFPARFLRRGTFARGLPVSMTLGALALSFAVLIGGTLGSVAAMRQNSGVDYLVTGIGALGLTIPNFVVAPVFQIVFGLTSGVASGRRLGERFGAQSHPPGDGAGASADRRHLAHDARCDDRKLAVEPHPHLAFSRPPAACHRHPRVTRCGLAGSVLSGTRRRCSAHRLGGGRDDLRSARHRTLFRRGCAQPRLHARHGHGGCIAVFVLLFNLVVDILYAFIDPRIRYD